MTKNSNRKEENEYTNCPHCGGRHKASARFCTKTGKALVVIPPEVMPEKAQFGDIFVSEPAAAPPETKPEIKAEPEPTAPVARKALKITLPPGIKQSSETMLYQPESSGKILIAQPEFKKSQDKTQQSSLKLSNPAPAPSKTPQKESVTFPTEEIPVKRCHNCGTPFSKPDAKFCIACGARIPVFDPDMEPLPTVFIPPVEEVKPPVLKPEITVSVVKEIQEPVPEIKIVSEPDYKPHCPNPDCNEPVSEGSKFCGNCYHRLEKCPTCGKYTDVWRAHCIFCKADVTFSERNWLQFKGDSGRTGNTSEEIKVPLERRWLYPDSRSKMPILSSPVVYKGYVYFGSSDMQIHAVNQYTGDQVWKKPTKGVITSTPAIYDDNIYTASGDGRIYAVEAKSGKPVWVFPEKAKNGDGTGLITAGILACESGIFAVNTSGEVFRIDASTGKLIWKVPTDSENLESTDGDESWAEQTSAPALMGNEVYIATRGGRLYCLDVETGTVRWKFPAESHLPSRFISTPALCNKLCYIPDRSGKFYAVSARTGEDTWADTVDLDSVVEGSPSVGFGKILTGTQSQWFIALNLHSGGELWRERNEKIRLLDSIFSTPTITKNGLVFYGSNSGNLYCRDINTGEEVWNMKLESPVRSAPAISDGHLYITTSGGYLYAFREKKD
ncbi:MAG: PQQ-binding-like beta-propeller repeat protein [Firmicutes bacterium]|nr:PQQ-binding-like beta-propeller repeat protein [Bacillota bacterium]